MRCAFDFEQLFVLRAAGVGEHFFGHVQGVGFVAGDHQ